MLPTGIEHAIYALKGSYLRLKADAICPSNENRHTEKSV
jgi:hypothetical protein